MNPKLKSAKWLPVHEHLLNEHQMKDIKISLHCLRSTSHIVDDVLPFRLIALSSFAYLADLEWVYAERQRFSLNSGE